MIRRRLRTAGKDGRAALASGKLQYHPLADLFPLLEGEAFDELVEDIRVHKVREPIWLYQGKILDGRNRYRAAIAAGVPCPTRTYEGGDPVGFVISLNLKRRHLSGSQRATLNSSGPRPRRRRTVATARSSTASS